MEGEARLPWRVGEFLLQGRYREAANELVSWCMLMVQEAPFHFIIETTLILFVVGLVLMRRKTSSKTIDLDPKVSLDGAFWLCPRSDATAKKKKVVDELCEEWQPDPLISPSETEPEMEFPAAPEVERYCAPYIEIGGKKLIDLASFGFLGLSGDAAVVAAAKEGVRKYGVGSCGPRGFYGTFDAHLEAEEELAKFFGAEEAIVFSSGYATVSSTIPAFAKRGDFLICDKGIGHAMQTGVLLSRANAYWFKHNDPEDLERVLLEVEKHQKSKGMNMDRPPVRKFLVIEGLYGNYGDVAPLKRYVELKKRHCFRIMMDDSMGFGVLGATGRGCLEHEGVPLSQVEVLTASLSNALGSVGGFCVGQKDMIYHQRLNAAGYVFSASSPPYLLVAACAALRRVEPGVLGRLAGNAATARALLAKHCAGLLTVHGYASSPIMHLRLERSTGARRDDAWLLQRISEEAMARGVAVPRCRYVDGEKYAPPTSLRVCVSSLHTPELLEEGIAMLAAAARKVIQKE